MTNSKFAQTAQLVAAYIKGNQVNMEDLPSLIHSVYSALGGTSTTEPVDAAPQAPAFPVKKSVTPGAIHCLECGIKLKMLKRHLRASHNLSTSEYKAKWGLPIDYPVVAPNYAQERSTMAIKVGLGRKSENGNESGTETVSDDTKPLYQYPASRWSKPSE